MMNLCWQISALYVDIKKVYLHIGKENVKVKVATMLASQCYFYCC